MMDYDVKLCMPELLSVSMWKSTKLIPVMTDVLGIVVQRNNVVKLPVCLKKIVAHRGTFGFEYEVMRVECS